MLDVINIMIERTVWRIRINQKRIDSDNAAALADRFDLLVADVAFDVVKFSRVRVRNDEWLGRKSNDVLKPFWVNMGQINDNTEPFAFAHDVATEGGKPVARRTAGRKNPTAAGSVAAGMRQADRAHAKLVKDTQQIQILA